MTPAYNEQSRSIFHKCPEMSLLGITNGPQNSLFLWIRIPLGSPSASTTYADRVEGLHQSLGGLHALVIVLGVHQVEGLHQSLGGLHQPGGIHTLDLVEGLHQSLGGLHRAARSDDAADVEGLHQSLGGLHQSLGTGARLSS